MEGKKGQRKRVEERDEGRRGSGCILGDSPSPSCKSETWINLKKHKIC